MVERVKPLFTDIVGNAAAKSMCGTVLHADLRQPMPSTYKAY